MLRVTRAEKPLYEQRIYVNCTPDHALRDKIDPEVSWIFDRVSSDTFQRQITCI